MKIYIVRHGHDDASVRGGWSIIPRVKAQRNFTKEFATVGMV